MLQAISALVKLAQCKPGLDALFRTHLKELKDVMATSDIIRYRVYEVCPYGLFTVVNRSNAVMGFIASDCLLSVLLL